MKSYLSKFGVLLLGVMFAVVGCQDYAEDIRDVNDQLDETTLELTAMIEQAIKDLEDADAATTSDLKAAKDEIKGLTEDVADLVEADGALSDRIDEAKQLVDNALSRIGTLETGVSGLQTDLDNIKNNILPTLATKTDLQNLKNELEAADAALGARIDAAEDRIAANEGDIAKILVDLKAAQDGLKAAQDDMTDHKAAYQALKDAYEAKVLVLEGAIAENKAAIAAETAARDSVVNVLRAEYVEADGKLKDELEELIKANEDKIKENTDAIADLKKVDEKLQKQLDDFIAETTEKITNVTDEIHLILHDFGVRIGEAEKSLKDVLSRLAQVEVDVEALLSRVQSIVYVPDYLDGYATLGFAKMEKPLAGSTTVEYQYIPRTSVLRYKVNARDAESEAKALAAAWEQDEEFLAYDLEQVKTRAAVSNDEELEIVDVTADGEYLNVHVVANNFLADFYEGDDTAYSASLRVVTVGDCDANDLRTEYTGLVRAEEALELSVATVKDGRFDPQLARGIFEHQTLAVNDSITVLKILEGVTAQLAKITTNGLEPLTDDEAAEFAHLEVAFEEETTYTADITAADFVIYDLDENEKTDSLQLVKPLPKAKVGQMVTIEHTYSCTFGEAVAEVVATSEVELTAEQIKAVFEPQVIDWTLELAKSLRGDAPQLTPYSKRIVKENVKYTKPDGKEFPYDLYAILQNNPGFTVTKTVTLNGTDITPDAIQAGDWMFPEATAELRLVTYEFPAAGEDPNVYEVKWVASSTDLYVEATGKFTLNSLPEDVLVDTTVTLNLPMGKVAFFGDCALVEAAYKEFGAKNAGFAEGAETNTLMYEALTDAANVDTPDPNTDAIKLNVDNNVDNSSVALTKTLYNQNKFVLTRTIETWFGVDFKYVITADPQLPENVLLPADDFMVADTVTVFGKIDAQGVYTIDRADLGKYLEIGEEINNNLAVKFEVVTGDVTIGTNDPVAVVPLGTPIKDAYGVIDVDKAVVEWATWNKTSAEIKATLIAEESYILDEKTFTLVTEDPLTFDFGDNEVVVTRLPGHDAIAKVYEDIVVKSIAEPSVANLADPDATSIQKLFDNSGAAHTYGLKAPVVIGMGVFTTDPRTTNPNELVRYNPQKCTIDEATGTVTLKADDGNLLYPIYAWVKVQFDHNIHDCVSSADIVVVFQPSAEVREMMNKFTNGGNIELTEDLTLSQPIVIDNPRAEVVLDLNGKTIQNASTGAAVEAYAIRVKQGKLIIKGDGTIDGGAGCHYNIALRVEGDAVAYIEGGYFKVGPDALGDVNNCIYAADGGKVFISGGKFESAPYLSGANAGKCTTLNLKDNTGASIEVTGGEFVNFNPSDNVSENPQVDFVKPGYHAELKPYSTTDYIVVAD